MRYFSIWLTIIFMILTGSVFAQDVSAEDEALQDRLSDVYASTTDLSDISVTVENGVVTLSGDIANSELAADAVEIASGQDGVIYVQDQIDRTLVAENDVSVVADGLLKDVANLSQALPIIALALVVFGLFFWLGGLAARRKRLWQKIAPNPFLGELLSQTVRVLFVVAGLVIAMNILGAEAMIATILGGAGVVGIAIGFAVRDTLENYLASIMLSLRQPFRQGDHVLIGEHEGIVMRLTSRATILMTLDGNHLRIPNATVFKAVILNYTTNPERRFSFELGVDAADDPVAAMRIGLEVMRSHGFVLTDPEPAAIITEVGDSNIVINFMGWVDQTASDFGKARSLCIRAVKDRLEADGFSLPEPIYRVKLDNMTGTKLDLETQGADKMPKPKRVSAGGDMDVAPDRSIDEKVEEENAAQGDNNLLDDSKPTE